MPRRRKVSSREILPDPKYGNVLVNQFISDLMRKGKRSLAERICQGDKVVVKRSSSVRRSRSLVMLPAAKTGPTSMLNRST